jgi:hypothetical protein
LIFNYFRQVSESVGVGEILSSPNEVANEPYIEINRLICSKCARKVSLLLSVDPKICIDCKNSIVSIYRDITDINYLNYPLNEVISGQRAKTLLFLCARKSNTSQPIKEGYFETLFDSVINSGMYSILKKNTNGFSFKKPPIHIAGNCVGLLTQI